MGRMGVRKYKNDTFAEYCVRMRFRNSWEAGILCGSKGGLIENLPSTEFSDFFDEDERVSPQGFNFQNRLSSAACEPVPLNWDDDSGEDGLGEIPRVNKLSEAYERLEEYMESIEQDDLSYDEVVSRRISTVTSTAARWTDAVNLMRDCRVLKERLIREKPLPVLKLDRLDSTEERALSILYGNFKFLAGFCDTASPELFDKNKFDEFMEETFGSINQPSDRKLDVSEARQIFSMYLSRKVWCLNPWRKLQTAGESFLKRTTTPIDKPVDLKACSIASRVLELLMIEGESEMEEFRKQEFAPESSCNERSKAEGGKRFALIVGGRRIWKHVKPVSIYTGGKIRTITKDSVKNVKFNWINKWLGSQFRKLNCSIFGGDVEEWFQKNRKIL
jgi:hypothetical protein